MAERIRGPQAEAIGVALEYVPPRLRPPLACDFFCADPIFAGIHSVGWAFETSECGVSYRKVAHCCWPHHVRDQRATVVLPKPTTVPTVLHELGHVLEGKLEERAGWEQLPDLDVVSEYGRTNYHELFAEAFLAWFYPPAQLDADTYWVGYSRSNAEFFDRLLLV